MVRYPEKPVYPPAAHLTINAQPEDHGTWGMSPALPLPPPPPRRPRALGGAPGSLTCHDTLEHRCIEEPGLLRPASLAVSSY